MGVSLIICPSAVWWWLRSPNYNNNNPFCVVNTDGSYSLSSAYASGGLLPGFAMLGQME